MSKPNGISENADTPVEPTTRFLLNMNDMVVALDQLHQPKISTKHKKADVIKLLADVLHNHYLCGAVIASTIIMVIGDLYRSNLTKWEAINVAEAYWVDKIIDSAYPKVDQATRDQVIAAANIKFDAAREFLKPKVVP